MWGRVWEGTMLLAPFSACFQSLSPIATSKLDPSGAGSRVGGLVYVLGPCGSLQGTLLWGWEFLPLPPQPPQVFSVRGLRLYFPELEAWVVQFVLLPSCSSWFICTRMWDCPVHQLLPRHESSLPGCPSAPLLQVWMNVSSLTTWLSDFHTVRFSVSSDCFFVYKFVVVLLLVVQGGTVCLPMPPSCRK